MMDSFYKCHDSVFQRVSFQLYSTPEIRQVSLKAITTHECYDRITGQRVPGGLYDPELGPMEDRDVCRHCSLSFWQCPGHTSHIEFPRPVYNPVLFDHMYKLLQLACLKCHRLPADDVSKLLLQKLGETSRSPNHWESFRQKHHEMLQYLKKMAGRQCAHCESWRPPLTHKSKQEIHTAARGAWHKTNLKRRQMDSEADADRMEEQNENGAQHPEDLIELDNDARILLPSEARLHLCKLFANEAAVLLQLFPFLKEFASKQKRLAEESKGRYPRIVPTDLFFMECMLVPPPVCRPPAQSFTEAGGVFVHPQTANLQRVVSQAQTLRNVLESSVCKKPADGSEPQTAAAVVPMAAGDVSARSVVTHCLIGLQKAVNCCFDFDLDRQTRVRQPGLKQLLDRKQGLVRMNMMGKRVNFACRSVISPDPYLAVDEVGIPELFALKLTFPEAVNDLNVELLRVLVCNGPNIYPGATHIQKASGALLKLPDNPKRRRALSKELMAPEPGEEAVRVYRHAWNGDPLIMNRQPTLHRPSMQVHRTRVLRARGSKTIRMHYANCKAYNADFDGDEMNGHFVQTYDAKAEAQTLAGVPEQYLVPKDGTPLAGLIQDHIIAAVKLTVRDRFLTRQEYCQLVFVGLNWQSLGRRIVLLPPAIVRPVQLWTGKQLLSTLLINLTPEGQPLINLSCPGKATKLTLWEGRRGAALRDVADVDLVVREGQLMTGVVDKAHIGPSSFGLVHCYHEAYGAVAATRLLTGITSVLNDFLKKVSFSLGIKDLLLTDKMDRKRRRAFRKIAEDGVCAFAKTFNLSAEELVPEATARLYRRAQFERRGHFAKKLEELDRNVKAMVTTPQEDICRQAIPLGLQEKFPRNNLQLMIHSGAKGSQVNAQQISVCLGQIELEGRRVPMMLSGRTMPCFRPYDISPRAGGLCTFRFLTGLPPQELFFHSMAGRDGLIDTAVKTSRSGYLQRSLIKHLEGLMVNYDCTVRGPHGEVVQFRYGDDSLEVTKTPFLSKLPFFANNAPIFDRWLTDLAELRDASERDGSRRRQRRMWKKIDRRGTEAGEETVYSPVLDSHVVRRIPPPGTVLDHFLPNVQPGAISESLRARIADCAKGLKTDVKPKTFERLIHAKYQRSVAQPGEPVGLLAAQSLGEPSTQMTLNTFHFAGRGEMNVTLGIPRLREVLMTGSEKMKTPCMSLPVQNTLQAHERVRNVIVPRFNKILLRDLVLGVSCVFEPATENYRVTFRFVNKRGLRHGWPLLSQDRLLAYMERKFLPNLAKVLSRHVIDMQKDSLMQALSSAVAARLMADGRRQRAEGGEEAGGDALKLDVKAEPDLRDREEEEEADADDEAVDAGREWNAELDGAEAVARKGWAGDSDQEGDERDFEGEEEEEAEVAGAAGAGAGAVGGGGAARPQDEFDEPLVSSGRPQLKGIRQLVKQEQLSDGHTTEDEAPRMAERQYNVVKLHSSFKNYEFGHKKNTWCCITMNFASAMGVRLDIEALITSEVDRAVVHSLKGIEKAILDTDDPNQWVLRTEGINFEEVLREPTVFDLNRIYTNSIHHVMRRYGVEAGRAAICKEVGDVFRHYGITVDPRHLSLVGDYMTASGGYRAFNRHGMAANASPLQRMSFETTTSVLKETLVLDQKDHLTTPSGAIMLGNMPHLARRSFDVLGPLVLK